MSSREKILSAIMHNQPAYESLPDISVFEKQVTGSIEKFAAMLSLASGKFFKVNSYPEIISLIKEQHGTLGKIFTIVPELASFYDPEIIKATNSHTLHDVEVAILKAHFGVAENGAIWITEQQMGVRALPFICQHLAIIVNEGNIVPTMHEAYELMGKIDYRYGTFIAGPSKTADIEQSLVIGAHGPRTMTIFLLANDISGSRS